MKKTPFRLLLAGLLAAGLTAACKNTETPAAPPEDPVDAAVAEPVRHYPGLVGASHPQSDGSSIDDTVSFREFKIPISPGESTALTAAYLNELDGRPDADSRITVLADLNAAFSSAFTLKLAPGKHWHAVSVHVGDFAQDYCGEISVVHHFETPTLAATHIDNSALAYELLSDANCPVKSDFGLTDDTPIKPGTDPFGDFCKARDKCLKAYFSDPAHIDRLRNSIPQALLDLHLE
ncbi:hypothetical protein Q9Q94_11055 [Uliginosibacterium sp. 31-16]|uniref:hypothetical protein n=1 Tax=Uliginosibacterium sp. 31-16 TaxID=3068315 RepID=UPI00273EC2A3|nr:hypothetical protein [Uliginosibacterium sp. 31-16]MDP5240073.1 hypothetical protein [Uliginosibacterium sp. 31-16]